MKLFVFAALLSIVKCSPTKPDNTPRSRDCSKKEEWMDQCKHFSSSVVSLEHGSTNVDCEIECWFPNRSPLSGGNCMVMTEKEEFSCFKPWDLPQQLFNRAIEIIPGVKALGDDNVDAVIDYMKPRGKGYFPEDIFSSLRDIYYKPSRGILACQAWLQQTYSNGTFVLTKDDPYYAVAKDGKCFFFRDDIFVNIDLFDGATANDNNGRSIVASRFCWNLCDSDVEVSSDSSIDVIPNTPTGVPKKFWWTPNRDCSKKEEWMDQCKEFPSHVVSLEPFRTNVHCEIGCSLGGGRHRSRYGGKCTVLTKDEMDMCVYPLLKPKDPEQSVNIYRRAIEIIPGLKAMGDDDLEAVVNALNLYTTKNLEFFKDFYRPSKGILVCQAWSQLMYSNGTYVLGENIYFALAKDGKCFFYYEDNMYDEDELRNAFFDATSLVARRYCWNFCKWWDMWKETDGEESSDSDVIQNTPTSSSEGLEAAGVKFLKTLPAA